MSDDQIYDPSAIEPEIDDTYSGGIREKPTPQVTSTDGEIPVIRWSNRRKMAWWAFKMLLVYTMFYWFILPLWFQYFGLPTDWLEIIGESFFWFAMTMSATILGYMGFTTMPFMGRGKGGNGQNSKYIIDGDDY